MKHNNKKKDLEKLTKNIEEDYNKLKKTLKEIKEINFPKEINEIKEYHKKIEKKQENFKKLGGLILQIQKLTNYLFMYDDITDKNTKENINALNHDISHIVGNWGIYSTTYSSLRYSGIGFIQKMIGKEKELKEEQEKRIENKKNRLRELEKKIKEEKNQNKKESFIKYYKKEYENLKSILTKDKILHPYNFINLYNEKALESSIKEFNENFKKSLELNELLASYIFETTKNYILEKKMINIIEPIKSKLIIDFFPLTNKNSPAKINIEIENNIEDKIKNPGTIAMIIYNLTKNALKRAEELYSKEKNFEGGAIKIKTIKEKNKYHISVLQTFEGIELEKFAETGYSLIENKDERINMIPKNSLKRLKNWFYSKNGELFEELKIKDIVEIAFLKNISGYDLHSKTSGIGLFAIKEITKEKKNKNLYYVAKKENNNFYKGFLLELS